VKNHPALGTYLEQHPEIREQVKSDPVAFMRQEDRFDRRVDRMDRDKSYGRLTSFGEFLGGHSDIAQQLSQDPSLVKNQEYMENHPELREYLTAHADVREELMADPQSFIKSAQQFSNTDGSRGLMTPMHEPKQ
jgi:hypothetical protein